MRVSPRRIGLIAAALSLMAIVVPAQAVEFLCGDICQCWVACSRRCTDDISGFSTTCGAAGYACNGQCFVAAAPQAEPTAQAAQPAAPDQCASAPALEDALAQP